MPGKISNSNFRSAWHGFKETLKKNNAIPNGTESNTLGPASKSTTTTRSKYSSKNDDGTNSYPEKKQTIVSPSEATTLPAWLIRDGAQRFNDIAMDLVSDLNKAEPEEQAEIFQACKDLKWQIQRVLQDCPANTNEQDIKTLIRALLTTEFPGVVIEVGQAKLDGIVNNLYKFRMRLIAVNYGNEFLNAFRRIATLGRENSVSTVKIISEITASAIYGGELFFSIVSTRPEWGEITYQLRRKSYVDDGVRKGWGKEMLQAYPSLASIWGSGNGNGPVSDEILNIRKDVSNLTIQATREKRRVARFDNDLIRHAKYEKQGKLRRKFFSTKQEHEVTVEQLFSFGTNNVSIILDSDKIKSFKNQSREMNISLFLALKSREKLTRKELELTKQELNALLFQNDIADIDMRAKFASEPVDKLKSELAIEEIKLKEYLSTRYGNKRAVHKTDQTISGIGKHEQAYERINRELDQCLTVCREIEEERKQVLDKYNSESTRIKTNIERLESIAKNANNAAKHVFSKTELDEIELNAQKSGLKPHKYLANIRKKDLLSLNKRQEYIELGQAISGKVLEKNKTNIDESLVGTGKKKPTLWQRIKGNVTLTQAQKGFTERAMEKRYAAFLSGIDGLFEEQLGTDSAIHDASKWTSSNFDTVRRVIIALQDNPEQFHQPPTGKPELDDSEENSYRIEHAWEGVVLRTALVLWMQSGKPAVDDVFKQSVRDELLKLGCTNTDLQLIGKIVTDLTEESFSIDSIENHYDISRAIMGQVSSQQAAEHLLKVLMSAPKPGMFLYLNRSQLTTLKLMGTFVFVDAALSGGPQLDISEAKITRTPDGFRVTLYMGSGGRGDLSGGAKFFDALRVGGNAGGGYRAFHGIEMTLPLENFGNNIHKLCQGVVSLVQGTQADGSALDFGAFMDSHVSQIRYFTQKQYDGDAGVNGAVRGNLFEADIGVGNVSLNASFGVGLNGSKWKKAKGLLTPDKKVNETLKQTVLSLGAEASIELGANLEVPIEETVEELGTKVPFLGKQAKYILKNIKYEWQDNKLDEHNELLEDANIGEALVLGSMRNMDDEQCKNYVRDRIYALLALSPVDLARLENGDFDEQISEFALLAKQHDSGENRFIKAYGKLSLDAEIEIRELTEQRLAAKELRAGAKVIKDFDEEIQARLDDPNNYVITSLGITNVQEGSGSNKKAFGFTAIVLGIGGKMEVTVEYKHWNEVQTPPVVRQLPSDKAKSSEAILKKILALPQLPAPLIEEKSDMTVRQLRQAASYSYTIPSNALPNGSDEKLPPGMNPEQPGTNRVDTLRQHMLQKSISNIQFVPGSDVNGNYPQDIKYPDEKPLSLSDSSDQDEETVAGFLNIASNLNSDGKGNYSKAGVDSNVPQDSNHADEELGSSDSSDPVKDLEPPVPLGRGQSMRNPGGDPGFRDGRFESYIDDDEWD
jgi:hypothetical protein